MNFKIKGKPCSEWTIPELKKALQRRKEKVGGKKEDLCIRLKESLKHPINKTKTTTVKKKSPKSVSVKLKPIDVKDSLFIFYSSMYYQVPGSKLALSELEKYGLTKSYLNKFTTYKQLWNNLT